MENRNNGRILENITRHFERNLAPKGFTLTPNLKKYTEEGVQTVEFDLVVEGKNGEKPFKYLIECRDRKSPQGTEWIERLAGRKQLHNFDKVIGVSSSGFADHCYELANRVNIELRTVTDLNNLWDSMIAEFTVRAYGYKFGKKWNMNLMSLDPNEKAGPVNYMDNEILFSPSQNGPFVPVLKTLANENLKKYLRQNKNGNFTVDVSIKGHFFKINNKIFRSDYLNTEIIFEESQIPVLVVLSKKFTKERSKTELGSIGIGEYIMDGNTYSIKVTKLLTEDGKADLIIEGEGDHLGARYSVVGPT